MAAPRSKNPILALLAALAALAIAVFLGTQGGGSEEIDAAVPSSAVPTASAVPATTPVSGTTTSPLPDAPTGAIPQAAWATLAAIDAGRWPPDDAPGTQGGRRFGNYEGLLPATGGVRYQEWDVNRKRDGRGRDAERIVTGSDRSAWYTDDHYESFTRMR